MRSYVVSNLKQIDGITEIDYWGFFTDIRFSGIDSFILFFKLFWIQIWLQFQKYRL